MREISKNDFNDYLIWANDGSLLLRDVKKIYSYQPLTEINLIVSDPKIDGLYQISYVSRKTKELILSKAVE